MPGKRKSPTEIKRPVFFHDLRPWQMRHQADRSELAAYVEASGKWEPVATIWPTAGASAADMAGFVGHLVNNARNTHELLQASVDALEICLEEGKLTAAAEQEADSIVGRIKKLRA